MFLDRFLRNLLLLIVFSSTSFRFIAHGIQYQCSSKHTSSFEKRLLIIATCDTRSGWKEFHAMKVWNVTGSLLRDHEKLSMINVCKGHNWGLHGFLTKPLLYVQYLEKIHHQYAKIDASSLHTILMDSDTFWSVHSLNHIWRNYDCARDGIKDLVISTEMSCWVGRYCNQQDIDRWYNDTSVMKSYSPFANSGVVMGKIHEVIKMLKYVIANNQSYYTTYGKKHKFDDQYAIADYAIKISPSVSALDYHQLISASCSIHAPGNPPDEGWPFLCRNRNGTLSPSCHIYNNQIRRQGHFIIDPVTCMAQRKILPQMSLQEELESLALTPLVWHGNGAGKRICTDLGYQSYKCYLNKINLTEEQYSASWDGGTIK